MPWWRGSPQFFFDGQALANRETSKYLIMGHPRWEQIYFISHSCCSNRPSSQHLDSAIVGDLAYIVVVTDAKRAETRFSWKSQDQDATKDQAMKTKLSQTTDARLRKLWPGDHEHEKEVRDETWDTENVSHVVIGAHLLASEQPVWLSTSKLVHFHNNTRSVNDKRINPPRRSPMSR